MFKRSKSDSDNGNETLRGETTARGDSATASKYPATAAGAERPSVGPSRPAQAAIARPGLEVYRRSVDNPNPQHINPQHKGESSPMPAESKKLIVGRDITLTGKISSCDRLIVEGRVEVELHDCHTIEIAETGIFKGAAEIESAEVSGQYEGSLTVRDHLLIHGTGHVSGTIRYGRIEIAKGGEINGDVKSIGAKIDRSPQRDAAKGPTPNVGQPAVAAGGSKG